MPKILKNISISRDTYTIAILAATLGVSIFYGNKVHADNEEALKAASDANLYNKQVDIIGQSISDMRSLAWKINPKKISNTETSEKDAIIIANATRPEFIEQLADIEKLKLITPKSMDKFTSNSEQSIRSALDGLDYYDSCVNKDLCVRNMRDVKGHLNAIRDNLVRSYNKISDCFGKDNPDKKPLKDDVVHRCK
jgi:hypothetical protein